MALKDIFKMTKANRYTADGREELIKAQEAVTEDRRYNIGEISEKTGLQKTANGWVKPKSGKQPGMNKMTSWGTPSEPSENVKHLKDPNPGIPSQGNDIAINGKAYKAHLGDTILTKSGQKYEYAGKTSTGKIRVTSREGSTPITTAIDEKEILGLSEPENMSPKEKAALRTAENNTESKPAPKSLAGTPNGVKNDPKLAKEIANMNHFKESKEAAQKAKREEALKADRREGEANAEAYRKSFNEKALKEWTESAKRDAKAYNENMVIMQHPGGQTTAVREGSPDVEKAEAKGYKKMSLVRPDGSVKKHEGPAGSKSAEPQRSEAYKRGEKLAKPAESTSSAPKTESKPDDKKNDSKLEKEESEFSAKDLPEVGQKITFNWKDKGITGIKGTVVGFKTINGKTYARVRGKDKSLSPTGEFNVNLQILKSDGPRLNTNKGKITGNIEQKNGIWEPIYGEPADSAPRILTGDTRIRVRK